MYGYYNHHVYNEFPSLKGFNLAIDKDAQRYLNELEIWFPSLKGFNLAIDFAGARNAQ